MEFGFPRLAVERGIFFFFFLGNDEINSSTDPRF